MLHIIQYLKRGITTHLFFTSLFHVGRFLGSDKHSLAQLTNRFSLLPPRLLLHVVLRSVLCIQRRKLTSDSLGADCYAISIFPQSGWVLVSSNCKSVPSSSTLPTGSAPSPQRAKKLFCSVPLTYARSISVLLLVHSASICGSPKGQPKGTS